MPTLPFAAVRGGPARSRSVPPRRESTGGTPPDHCPALSPATRRTALRCGAKTNRIRTSLAPAEPGRNSLRFCSLAPLIRSTKGRPRSGPSLCGANPGLPHVPSRLPEPESVGDRQGGQDWSARAAGGERLSVSRLGQHGSRSRLTVLTRPDRPWQEFVRVRGGDASQRGASVLLSIIICFVAQYREELCGWIPDVLWPMGNSPLNFLPVARKIPLHESNRSLSLQLDCR